VAKHIELNVNGKTQTIEANAIFDATGVRMRQAPFTPEWLKRGIA